jgi:hypothetical protein
MMQELGRASAAYQDCVADVNKEHVMTGSFFNSI